MSGIHSVDNRKQFFDTTLVRLFDKETYTWLHQTTLGSTTDRDLSWLGTMIQYKALKKNFKKTKLAFPYVPVHRSSTIAELKGLDRIPSNVRT